MIFYLFIFLAKAILLQFFLNRENIATKIRQETKQELLHEFFYLRNQDIQFIQYSANLLLVKKNTKNIQQHKHNQLQLCIFYVLNLITRDELEIS